MSEIGNKITRGFGKVRLWGIKRSPELLLAGGIISGTAALVLAVKETLKVEEILDEHIKKLDDVKSVEEGTELVDSETGKTIIYDDKTKNKVIALTYVKTAGKLLKHYAPTIIFASLSLTCILTSHGILRKRNIALAASLATVRTAYDEYRGRVIRDLGREMDEHFLYDTKEEVREKEVTDPETGKTKKLKEKIQVPQYQNAYSRIFDNCNAPDQFEKDGAANYIFIRSQMLYLQQKLIRDGYLFLNDAYKQLGFPITLAGQSAGWIYDYDNKEGTQIFFEGFDEYEINNSKAVRDLMNGRENSIIINFLNIRDNILTDIPRVDSKVATI